VKPLTIRLLVALAIIASVAGAQTHDHPRLPLGGPSVRAPVRYSLTVTAIPDSAIVRGLAEVLYENRSDDPLGEVAWDAGQPLSLQYRSPEHDLKSDSPVDRQAAASLGGGHCRLDSVLYLGAPCQPEQVTLDGSTMVITLDVPIPPGEKGFFLVFFETALPPGDRSDSPVLYNHWFPMITSNARTMRERGDLRVRLEADSSYDLIHPGELMNAKELQGLLPKLVPDSVYVDIVERYQIEYSGVRYRPVFESGRKRFYVRLTNATGLPLAFVKGIARDRIAVDSTVIEYCYEREFPRTEPGLIAGRAAAIVPLYQSWLGEIPLRHINITSLPSRVALADVSLVALPENSADPDLITGVLAIRLAHLWLAPTIPSERVEQQYVDEGLATYLAMRALGVLYPSRASTMIEKAEAWLYYQGFVGGVPDFVFRTVPNSLHMARFAVGDSSLWHLLRDYATEHRYGFAPGDLSTASTTSDVDPNCPDLNRLLSFAKIDFDLAVTSAAADDSGVAFSLTNHGLLRLPIETAVVYGFGDTLFDTLQCGQVPGPGETTSISISTTQLARCVILDPHFLLLDTDRRNNVLWLQRTKDRLLPPDDLFPGYRRATGYGKWKE